MAAFSRLKLLVRNLSYFRAANLAVVAGMAVATAVLAGALMVGDSVRGSLRELAERRLGFVDHALMSPRFLDQGLAKRLAAADGFADRFASITPGVLLRGGVAGEGADAGGGTTSRVAGVQVGALADRHAVPAGQAVVNGEVAAALEQAVGRPVRFSLPAPDEAPRDATLARRSRSDTITTFSVPKSAAAPAGSFEDLFNLTGGQRAAPAAWVNLADLQSAIDRDDQANAFFVAANERERGQVDADALNQILRRTATLADYGLETGQSADKSEAVLTSKSTYVHPAIIDAAAKVAQQQNVPLRRVSVYLANRVSKVGEGAADAPPLHYAMAAGIDRLPPIEQGGPPAALAVDEVAVNQWTAEQMKLKVGDTLRLEYYLRQPNGDLAEVASDRPGVGVTFKVARVLPMSGIGADPTLTPTYTGLTDADTIADWRPPAGLTIDKKRVTKEDERYWGQHKAAPKVFVNLETAKRLWGTAFGDVTSLRVPADKAAAFTAALQREIDPAALGLVFRPVRAQQLQAASGGTEFGGLFIGFSFFLLIAAVLLVAMLFRLSIEQRARQLGLLAACGFAPKQLRNLCLREGLILALIGGLIGCGIAVGYTALIVHGLRTWWVGAIGTTALRLHVVPATLAMGLAGSVVVALLAILWAVRRVGRASASSLLAGALGTSAVRLAKPPRVSVAIAAIGLLLAIALFAGGMTRKIGGTGAYLGGGSLLLLAALFFTFARLRPTPHAVAHLSLPALAARNATRNRTRSLLCVALIALASFTLVTVSSMETSTPRDTFDPKSGAGGYGLIVQTDIPLLGDLNTLEGRQLLMRLPSAKDPRWDKAKFAMMRAWAGQDISCLNITRPDSPTILAVPPAMAQPGRFTFASALDKTANPWTLLDQPQADENTIPVIADDESAKYILHLGVGETMPITDAAGRKRNLKLVATLAGSIFQSEMLMSEANFLKLFPAQSGFTTVLVETRQTDAAAVTELLRETLNDTRDQEKSDYSASIETTAARLHAYHQVANTYLSTFRVLGSLGLMLGTVGLAVVLVRNLIERRPELALLAALGFNPGTRTRLVLWENASLLLLGLVIGAGCALAGVIPNVLTSAHRINVPALATALAAVLVVGLLSLVIAVRLAGRRITPAALRAE